MAFWKGLKYVTDLLAVLLTAKSNHFIAALKLIQVVITPQNACIHVEMGFLRLDLENDVMMATQRIQTAAHLNVQLNKAVHARLYLVQADADLQLNAGIGSLKMVKTVILLKDSTVLLIVSSMPTLIVIILKLH